MFCVFLLFSKVVWWWNQLAWNFFSLTCSLEVWVLGIQLHQILRGRILLSIMVLLYLAQISWLFPVEDIYDLEKKKDEETGRLLSN